MHATKLIPVFVALALAAGACSGSRPALDPTVSLAPTTSPATATTSGAESTTTAVASTTSVIETTSSTTVTTLPTATTEYPSVGPLETVPPAVYPTTG